MKFKLKHRRILVTGGVGFIGSALVRRLSNTPDVEVLNFDKLTYAANLNAVAEVHSLSNYHFAQADICDVEAVRRSLYQFAPDAVVHLAAESHVDRSIEAPTEFFKTNVEGTSVFLEQCLDYWRGLDDSKKNTFRFIYMSTDEVFGSLELNQPRFNENSNIKPSSPYAASKAAGEVFSHAWYRTFGLPTIIVNCSNNYGPFQNAEKLIPKTITRALTLQTIPLYGNGKQIRDWLFIEDTVEALVRVLESGNIGEKYCIGGDAEVENVLLVAKICEEVENLVPFRWLKERTINKNRLEGCASYQDLVRFVEDRPGHDFRYGIDASKAKASLNWKPDWELGDGLSATISHYVDLGGTEVHATLRD